MDGGSLVTRSLEGNTCQEAPVAKQLFKKNKLHQALTLAWPTARKTLQACTHVGLSCSLGLMPGCSVPSPLWQEKSSQGSSPTWCQASPWGTADTTHHISAAFPPHHLFLPTRPQDLTRFYQLYFFHKRSISKKTALSTAPAVAK